MKQLAPAPFKAPPTPSIIASVSPQSVLRKCGCGGTCPKCEEEKKHAGVVQRQSNGGSARGGVLAPAVSSRIAAASGGGSALPRAVNQSMSSRFGRDFSSVRIHSDSTADSLSRQIGAEAFTTGNNIFFAAGRYNPYTTPGQRLLAHELTHVVQQGSGAAGVQTKLELGAPNTAAEREADRVAEQVVSGGAAGSISALTKDAVQRQPTAVSPPAACVAPNNPQDFIALGPVDPATGTRQIAEDAVINGRRICKYTLNVPFSIPAIKASSAPDLYNLVRRYREAAANAALRTTHGGRTSDIWAAWSRSRGAAGEEIARRGPQGAIAGGNARDLCSPDHLTELNVGGSDDANNLRLLSRPRNEAAGRFQGTQIANLYSIHGIPRDANHILEFRSAESTNSEGSAAADACLAVDPMGQLDSRGQIVGLRPTLGGGLSTVGAFGESRLPADRAAVNVNVGGNPVAIIYRVSNGQIRGASETTPYAVPGLVLLRYNANEETFDADVPATRPSSQRRLPLKPGELAGSVLEIFGTTRLLRFRNPPPHVRLAFPFLSEAALEQHLENGVWFATGSFSPSLPILRNVVIQLEIRNGELQGRASVPADAIRRALPVPGLTIDPVNLGIAIANGEFSATGGIGFRYGSFADGQVTAALSNAAGFSAEGAVNLHIPGIDRTQGRAWIRNGRFGGELILGMDKIRFPGVQSGRLVVGFADGQLTGTGTLVLGIPGLRDTTLTFTANSQGQYSITGTATGTIPGLRDPRIEIAYANGGLSGTGTAGFIIPGLEGGNLTLRYANGQFSGSASIDYRRGRLTGRITANLSPAFRLSGRGELGYEIAPGLTALVGLELRENGTARVSGELRLPDPIEIFPARNFDRRLFGISIDIPIFGISFGSRSVGIIANISASLNARAGIGPGQIRRPRITASFDPSSDQGSTSFQASAELYVPASAEIAAVLSGGIGASLLIVRALGGIQATGSVGLQGALAVPIELRYQAGRFTVDGAAELTAEPKLRFNLDAFARVEADLLLTTIELYSKTWRLAAFEWGSNFRIGLRFPVHYVFGEPFRLSLDQLQFIAPEINARQIIRDLLPR